MALKPAAPNEQPPQGGFFSPEEYNPLSESMTLEDEPITLVDDGEMPQPDIMSIIAMRDAVGEEGLTDAEYALLADFERASRATSDPENHYANLADHVEPNELKTIAQNILNWVDWDEESRSEWQETERKGIRLLGVSPNIDGGARFKGASTVVHPLLAEACIQFGARALDALWPSGGPVKTAVLGAIRNETQEQAKRVENFLNYQYTQLMPGAFDQTDNLLLRIPLSGSVFVKGYYDPINGVCRSMVEPADFIVPYRANDLRSSPRYTERILMSKNDVRKRQVAGLYRDIKLIEPREDSHEQEREIVIEEIKDTEGREDQTFVNDDQRRTLLECYCELDVPGFEDVGEDGRKTGIELPYVVTVDKDSMEVLSIYRNWKPEEPQKKKIVYHTHYRFMPGLGFYGYGLYHWIGGLARATTGSLRALMDSAQFANLSGGFRAKDAAIKNGDEEIAPGEWKEIDADAQDLAKAFFPLPYKEPSATLFNLLGHLEELGRRIAGTTDALVGDGNQNTPVGTMLARIEQGGKIFTSIQRRLFEAASQEYKLIAWLDSIYLPDQYPYAVQGEDRQVFRKDFDDRVDVIPVADPNFVSNTQRYFVSQATIELAAGAPPGLYDMHKVHRRALESLRIDNIDELLPSQDKQVVRMDLVTEGAAAMVGRPIKAFPEQNHQAHIVVHQAQLAMLGDPNSPQAAMLVAHIQEHMALHYLAQMQAMTGVPFSMPGDGQEAQPMPTEMENQIAMLAAQAVQQMLAQQQQQPDPEAEAIQAEQQRKDAVAQSDIQRRDAEAEANMRRADIESSHGMQLKEAELIQNAIVRNKEQEAKLHERAKKTDKP